MKTRDLTAKIITKMPKFDCNWSSRVSLGAQGYVVKIKAASELLTAVEAVLMGKTFVSSTIGNG